MQTLAQGIYTSVVHGVRNGAGDTLSEVYLLGSSDEATLITAVGTRSFVSVGDKVLISGLILAGTGPVPVLVRALGPSLSDAGIPRTLENPTLELYGSDGNLIASNDNWRDTQEAEILATGLAPDDDLESAVVLTLDPGAYTAVVSGTGNPEGIGFVQFYSLATPGPELDPAPIIR